MKKIVVVGLMMTILLTGCGVPDRVAEEAKKIQKGYISDYDEVKQINTKIRDFEKQEISFGEDSVISAKQSEKIKLLYETLERLKREGLFEDKYIEFQDWHEGKDEFTGAEKRARLEEYIYGKRSWKEWASSFFTYDSWLKTEEDYMHLAEELEKVGFTGLKDVKLTGQQDYAKVCANGIQFDIWLYYRDESNAELESIDVVARVEKKDFFYLPQFAEWMEEKVDNGFVLTGLDYEGYLQRLVYTGSYSINTQEYTGDRTEGITPFQKSIEIYMKNNEFLQMEIDMTGTQSKKGELVFSEEEKGTVKNFIAWASGDEEGAKEFVEKPTADGDKKGTIGNCEWYRIDKSGTMGAYKNIQFRFVTKEK